MAYFSKSILINCSTEDAFSFHCDTRNLPLITPPDVSVKIIRLDLPLRQGSQILLEIKQFGFVRSRWKIEISEFKPYGLITDTQLEGPFRKWIHRHVFETVEDGTLMKDEIEFELPFGIAGKLAEGLALKMIGRQFGYRHAVTKRILENRAS